MRKIKTIELDVSKLMLDPNNPRLGRDNKYDEDVLHEDDLQLDTYALMNDPSRGFNITSLEGSIKRNTFSNIENVWVKKLKNIDKYIVVEGNRRVTAIKNLLKQKNDLDKDVLESISTIECKDLSHLGDNEEDTNNKITILLGFKHIKGGTLDWKIFPTAQLVMKDYCNHLYHEYDKGGPETFNYITYDKALDDLKDRYSTDKAEIKRLCICYRIYMQLKVACIDQCKIEFDEVKHFGKIYEGLYTNPILKKRYILHEKTGTISDQGVEEFLDLIVGISGERDPVLKGTSTGPSSIRDFAWIVKNDDTDNKEYIDNVITDREPAGRIKSSLDAIVKEDSILKKLKTCNKALDLILNKEMRELGGKEKLELNQIKLQVKNMLAWKQEG